MIEFALTALVFFAMMLGVVEFGRVLWIANGLHYAVQQAARCGAIGSSSCSNVATYAAGVAGNNVPSSAFATNSSAPCGYQVTATYQVRLYVPYVNMNPTLHAQACFPKSS